MSLCPSFSPSPRFSVLSRPSPYHRASLFIPRPFALCPVVEYRTEEIKAGDKASADEIVTEFFLVLPPPTLRLSPPHPNPLFRVSWQFNPLERYLLFLRLESPNDAFSPKWVLPSYRSVVSS